MAIELLTDLSDLSVEQLYAVYLAIARSDHQWRQQTMYGEDVPRGGPSEFRPLSNERFNDRLQRARAIDGGEEMFRGRLARQAAAYEVDVAGELTQLRSVA